jgi:Glycosyl transferase family 2
MTALQDFLTGLETTTDPTNARLKAVPQATRLDKIVIAWLYQPMMATGIITHQLQTSLWNFVKYDREEREVLVDFEAEVTPYIPTGRNMLVEKFLHHQADWLLMVDWDITFAPTDVYKLLDAADDREHAIICGCYATFFGEGNKLRPCWMHQLDDQEFIPCDDYVRDELNECTAVGMGFTLIHRSVLEAVGEANKHDPWKWFGQANLVGAYVAEDIAFCSRARRLGFGVWGHGGVQLGHTKSKTWWPSDIEGNP